MVLLFHVIIEATYASNERLEGQRIFHPCGAERAR
jgi:hypothetical protein